MAPLSFRRCDRTARSLRSEGQANGLASAMGDEGIGGPAQAESERRARGLCWWPFFRKAAGKGGGRKRALT